MKPPQWICTKDMHTSVDIVGGDLALKFLYKECPKQKETFPKHFFKIVDDYLISYDGDYFDMHKPSDIRSLIYIANRMNGYSELQCEYNDGEMKE